MNTRIFSFAAAISFIATSISAHEYKVGDLVVDHPMAFETATTAQTGGGFLMITNNGAVDDTLLGVAADFPRVEIHTTEMDGDIARMMKVDGITIPAGETVALEPGGFHVMFMGLRGDPFEVGEEIPATLTFEKAGDLEVTFKVEKRNMDHGTMDHSTMDHGSHGNH